MFRGLCSVLVFLSNLAYASIETPSCAHLVATSHPELDRAAVNLSDPQIREALSGKTILLAGDRGDSKSTQAQILAERFSFATVSNGGFSQVAPSKTVLIDGFASNTSQFEDLEKQLRSSNRNIDFLISLFAADSVERQAAQPLLQKFGERDVLYSIEQPATVQDLTSKIIEVLVTPERFSGPLTARQKLQYQLEQPRFRSSEEAFAQLIAEFRDAALVENAAKRTGAVRRFIYLLTGNSEKVAEFVHLFDRYGIEILQVLPSSHPWLIEHLLKARTPELVPVAVLSEQTQLLKVGTSLPSSLAPGVLADHVSELQSFVLEKSGEITQKSYRHLTSGKIVSPVAGQMASGSIFGWDDRFQLVSTGKTYHAHRMDGLKISSRDMVVSQFLADRIYYRELKNLSHTHVPLTRPIDFRVDVADFVRSEPLYFNPVAKQYGIGNMLNYVLNDGLFFRGASTRPEANLWLPSLNAGLPLVAKKDLIHAITFMFHDLSHFRFKDLIFTGGGGSLRRQVYITHRMMSEALTIMLADGMFVDSLAKSGQEYDFTKRKIYPLFLDLGIDLRSDLRTGDRTRFLESLRKILHASVTYTLKGDDSEFRKMLAENGKSDAALVEFKEKYQPFFVSDFQWTEHNYNNMVSRSEEIRRWWRQTKPIRDSQPDVKFETIDDFIARMPPGNDMVERVFDTVFESAVRPMVLTEVARDPATDRLRRGFVRYIVGQMAIFSRFASVPETTKYQERVRELCLQNSGSMGHKQIDEIRLVYEQYVDLLRDKNIISADEAHNFREVYPLFEPFYVTYDKNEEYPELATVASRVLNEAAHRDHQFLLAEAVVDRALTKQEKRYHAAMATLVEQGNGQIEEGLFVTEPGFSLLARTEPVTDASGVSPVLLAEDISATFLLSGIALETSMELIAHTEAAGARLTSSKTQAMGFPLFRVQEEAVGTQKNYLKQVLRHRAAFEAHYDPRASDSVGNELFNMTAPASKATALTYTMNLEDFHKLFIGRMGEAGNETEVRQLVSMMAAKLHSLYPEYIASPEHYLEMGNGEKYRSREKEIISEVQPRVEGAPLRLIRVGESRLTAEAESLFRKVNIDVSQSAADQLAEFRSRITYLAFAKSAGSSAEYNHRMIRELKHLSVLGAYHVSYTLRGASAEISNELIARILRAGGKARLLNPSGDMTMSLSLKQYHKLLKDLGARSLAAGGNAAWHLADALHASFPLAILSPAEYGIVFQAE